MALGFPHPVLDDSRRAPTRGGASAVSLRFEENVNIPACGRYPRSSRPSGASLSSKPGAVTIVEGGH